MLNMRDKIGTIIRVGRIGIGNGAVLECLTDWDRRVKHTHLLGAPLSLQVSWKASPVSVNTTAVSICRTIDFD